MSNLDQVMNTLNKLGRGIGSNGGEGGSKDFSKTLYYKIPKTTQKFEIRVLPSKNPNSTYPGEVVASHFKLPIARKDEKDFGTRRCLAIHGMPCAICDVLSKFSSMGLDTKNWTMAVQGKLDVMVISDPSQPDVKSNEVRIMTATEGMNRWLMEKCQETNGAMFDPLMGRNIKAHREKVDGKVMCEPAMDPSSIAGNKVDMEAILSQRHDLDKIFKAPTDNDINENREVAQAIERSLSERLKMINGGGDSSNAGNMNGVIPSNNSELPPATPPSTPLTSLNTNKPPQAPNCFGDVNVFNATRAECMNCVWDFQCKKTTGK